MTREEMATLSVGLTDRLHAILAGQAPEVQGAAIMQLLALYIAAHHPSIRHETFNAIMSIVPAMVPIAESEIFGPGGFPMEGLN